MGELKLISLETGATIAMLKYELNTTEELAKSIASYQVIDCFRFPYHLLTNEGYLLSPTLLTT